MITLTQKTWKEINTELAKRMENIRRRRKISRQELAEKSGVSLGSIKRFEQTGEISLQSLTKIAIALDLESEMENIFSAVPYQSIEEVINGQNR